MVEKTDVVAVHVGYAKDSVGFRCSVMENPVSGRRYLAYSPEDWWLREQHIRRLKAMDKEVPQDKASELAIET